MVLVPLSFTPFIIISLQIEKKYVKNDIFTQPAIINKNMQPEAIKYLIEAALKQSEAIVNGDGKHFSALVVCPIFTNKSRLERQQLVYDTVKKQLLDGTLHALSIKTFTPEEWQIQEHGKKEKG
jgi:acid stress-induced BolA-like protein IbaG/YrbA